MWDLQKFVQFKPLALTLKRHRPYFSPPFFLEGREREQGVSLSPPFETNDISNLHRVECQDLSLYGAFDAQQAPVALDEHVSMHPAEGSSPGLRPDETLNRSRSPFQRVIVVRDKSMSLRPSAFPGGDAHSERRHDAFSRTRRRKALIAEMRRLRQTFSFGWRRRL